MGANDRALAIELKTRELLALRSYRATREALDAADKTQRRMRQFDTSTPMRQALAKAGVLDQIDQVLERHEFRRVPDKVLDQRESLRAYLARVALQAIRSTTFPRRSSPTRARQLAQPRSKSSRRCATPSR